MNVEVLVETVLPPEVDKINFEELTRFALLACAGPGLDVQSWDVTVLLTDDERIRRLHRDFLGEDSPTDVMTFPHAADDFSMGEVAAGGDIVISVERATTQAAEFGATAANEVRFLVVHGVLHLCGWDDTTDDMRSAMHQRQAEILTTFDAAADPA